MAVKQKKLRMQWAWLNENVGSRRWWLSLSSMLVVGLVVPTEPKNLTYLLVSRSQTKIFVRFFFFVLIQVTHIYIIPPIPFLRWAPFENLNDMKTGRRRFKIKLELTLIWCLMSDSHDESVNPWHTWHEVWAKAAEMYWNKNNSNAIFPYFTAVVKSLAVS